MNHTPHTQTHVYLVLSVSNILSQYRIFRGCLHHPLDLSIRSLDGQPAEKHSNHKIVKCKTHKHLRNTQDKSEKHLERRTCKLTPAQYYHNLTEWMHEAIGTDKYYMHVYSCASTLHWVHGGSCLHVISVHAKSRL